MRLVNSDPTCPPIGDKEGDIPSKLTAYFDVGTCGNVTAQVFSRQADTLRTLTACGAPISTFVPVTLQSDLIRSNLTAISIVTNLFSDIVISSNFDLQVAFDRYISNAVQFLLVNPTLNLTSFELQNGDLQSFLTSLGLRAANLTILDPNFLAQHINSSVQRDLIIAKAEQNNQLVSDSIVELRANNDIQENITASIVERMSAVENATQNYVDKANALILALEQIQNKKEDNCDEMSFFFSGIICYLKQLLKVMIYCIVIAVIAYAFYWVAKEIYYASKANKKSEAASAAKTNTSGLVSYIHRDQYYATRVDENSDALSLSANNSDGDGDGSYDENDP
jgi:hypothetical protein